MNDSKSSAQNEPKTTFKSIATLILVSILFAVFVVEISTRFMPQLIQPWLGSFSLAKIWTRQSLLSSLSLPASKFI